jgi:Arc/MetJ family transcription regulator
MCINAVSSCIDVSHVNAYRLAMRKHTTIDLDADLVRAAAEALGTTRTTDTVHAALSEVVRRRQRMAITAFRPALDLADLDAMRAHRFAEDRAPYEADPPAPK